MERKVRLNIIRDNNVHGISEKIGAVKVYLIRSGESNYYKIGKTTKDLVQRKRELQTGNPERLVIVGFTVDYGEKYLHELFNEYSHINEWFLFPPEVIDKVIGYFPNRDDVSRQRSFNLWDWICSKGYNVPLRERSCDEGLDIVITSKKPLSGYVYNGSGRGYWLPFQHYDDDDDDDVLQHVLQNYHIDRRNCIRSANDVTELSSVDHPVGVFMRDFIDHANEEYQRECDELDERDREFSEMCPEDAIERMPREFPKDRLRWCWDDDYEEKFIKILEEDIIEKCYDPKFSAKIRFVIGSGKNGYSIFPKDGKSNKFILRPISKLDRIDGYTTVSLETKEKLISQYNQIDKINEIMRRWLPGDEVELFRECIRDIITGKRWKKHVKVKTFSRANGFLSWLRYGVCLHRDGCKDHVIELDAKTNTFNPDLKVLEDALEEYRREMYESMRKEGNHETIYLDEFLESGRIGYFFTMIFWSFDNLELQL